MTRIDRYILSEISVPLLLGFFVYTFILLIQVIFKSADLLVRSEASTSLVLKLFALSLPAIVVLTLPMALLFGILIGIGRLSADSEITALRASGLSLFTLYRPVALLSLFILGINLYLMIEILPRGNKAFSDLRYNILEKAALSEIKPNSANVVFGGRLLYIFGGETKDHLWSKVFIADSVANPANTAITADSGYAVPAADGDESLLVLKQATSHRLDFAKVDNYDLLLQDDYQIRLTTGLQGAAGVIKRSLRELSFSELRQRATSSDQHGRNLISIEIQKRFGFPFACVVFGLVGMPLGIVGARSGRSAGFALSIGIIVIYYVVFNTGEESARDGTIPAWLAVWLPNILFAVAGIWMLTTRNSDSGGGYWATFRQKLPALFAPWKKIFLTRKQALVDRVRQEKTAVQPNIKVRLARIQLIPLGNIDSYVGFAFLRILLLCSLSLVAIFLIADLTENIEDFLRNQVTADVIVSHYRSKVLLTFYQISPIILLVSTIFTFAVLAKSNELVALRAVGLSFLRISAPVVLSCAFIALGLFFLQSRVLSEMNRDANHTRELIKHGTQEAAARASPLGRDKQWIIGRDGRSIFNFLYFDESRLEIDKLQGFFFDDDFKIVSRFFAEKAKYLGDGSWLVSGGWKRDFQNNVVTNFQQIAPVGRIRLAESPDFLRKGVIPHEEMNNRELKDYLRDLEASGRSSRESSVAYGERFSYPLTAFVMCLVALPFSFRYEKRGALYGVGFAIVIGFSLVIALAFFKAMGTGGFMPPMLSVWIPPTLFAFFSMYLFLGVQS
jgi:LPS export ABC transporter permease LptF/LPS export ABC transporter permease LptG